MTHDEAKESKAAEAYILDDLDPAGRNAFEEHFFDCTDCAADVLDAAKIADGIRTGTNVVQFPKWRLAAAAAAAVIAILLGYRYLPHVSPEPANVPTQMAAAAQPIDLDTPRAAQTPFVIKGNGPVSIGFVIPVTEPHPPYVCELRDDAKHVLQIKQVNTKEEAMNPVTMLLPAGQLHRGHYTLAIRGEREIPPYDFSVEVQ